MELKLSSMYFSEMAAISENISNQHTLYPTTDAQQ